MEISKTSWTEKPFTRPNGKTGWKKHYNMRSDPTKQDSDGDGLTDSEEKTNKTNPLNPDTDYDCFPDNIDEDPIRFTVGKDYFYVYAREGHDFKKQAAWMSKYAYKNKNSVFIYITQKSEFIEKWNSPEFKYAHSVHLYFHGGEGVLYFYNETMSYADMNCLDEKYIQNMVYLYSCQGGTKFEGSSVAWKISEKINGTKVEALEDDYVDYFNPWNIWSMKPIMHEDIGAGKWCYFYSIRQPDNKYRYYREEIGDDWKI